MRRAHVVNRLSSYRRNDYNQRVRQQEVMMLYSAGPCPVCDIAGDALFVKDATSGRLFFFCPSCGCAWLHLPQRYKVETADPPDRFAPHGLAVATRADIVAHGWEGAIAREMDEAEWVESLQDWLTDSPLSEAVHDD